MDMNQRKSSKTIPRTSRITDKILEYYMKYGQHRDLEKFLRLYSPTDSQNQSQQSAAAAATTSSGNASGNSEKLLQCLRKMALNVSKEQAKSQSLPNINCISSTSRSAEETTESEDEAEELLVAIQIEAATLSDDNKESKVTLEDASNPELSDDVRTPKQTRRIIHKHTQTPESAAKTHRRLEWDSMADIGYKKSMSTSNISTLERTLLKEIFKEALLENKEKPAVPAIDFNVAPNVRTKAKPAVPEMDFTIAVNALEKDMQRLQQAEAAKPCTPPLASSTLLTLSNNSKKKMCHQSTSMAQLQLFEKSVQTSMHRLHGSGGSSNNDKNKHKQQVCQEVQVNLSSTGSSMFCGTATPSSFEYFSSRSGTSNEPTTSKKTTTVTKTTTTTTKQAHPMAAEIDRILSKHKVLPENKEPQKPAKTHSTVTKQPMSTNSSSSSSKKENSHESFGSNSSAKQLELGVQLLCSLIEAKGVSSKRKKQLVQNIVQRITRLSAGADSTSSLTDAERSSIASYLASSIEQLKKSKQQQTQSGVSNSTTTADESEGTSKPPPAALRKSANLPAASNAKASTNAAVASEQSLPQKKTHATASKSSTISSAAAATVQISSTTSSSCSKEPTTQKSLNQQLNNSNNTDADQPTIQEWLNPMTQSEIEYEQRRREFLKNKEKREKLLNDKEPQDENEREQQLMFVRSEIKRLKALQQLLDEDIEKSKPSKAETKAQQQQAAESNSSERIYESLSGTNSTDKSNCYYAKKAGNIQVTVDLGSNTSSSSSSSSSAKPSKQQAAKKHESGKKKNVVEIEITKEKVPHNRRSKMATPTTVDDGGSVRDYAQQRKQEFLQHYQGIKQQQQQQTVPRQAKHAERKVSENSVEQVPQHYHYSLPHTMQQHQQCPMHSGNYYCRYHYAAYLPPTYAAPAPPPPPPAAAATSRADALPTVGNLADNAASSSASMLQLSSDVSVPMGTHANSSSSTTTHQYDDVAVTGVPTSSSMAMCCCMRHRLQQANAHSPAHCMQVRSAKPIAYTVQFNAQHKATFTAANPKTINDKSRKQTQQQHKSNMHLDENSESITSAVVLATSSEQSILTLAEALRLRRPDFIANSKKRKEMLNEMHALQQQRQQVVREIVENDSIAENVERKLRKLPPAPIKKMRLFNTQEMRAITRKRCATLPEVLQRQQREREARRRRGNRIMQHVFSRRLLQRVRRGQPSLNHTGVII